jgi:hypothetical protein
MFLSYALGIAIVFFVLLRQTRIRPVPRFFTARFPVVLGLLGLLDVFSYTRDHHHVTGADYLWVLGTLLVGAVLLGAVSGLTVRLWTSNGWVVRQGTTATMVLWMASLALHFFVDGGGGHAGASGLEEASLLLYLGLTIGAQSYVIHRRAVPLWNELGPDAGRRLQFLFGSVPGQMGAFFANFGGNAGGSAGPGAPSTHAGDADIIDVEVVEDDDAPELPRSR